MIYTSIQYSLGGTETTDNVRLADVTDIEGSGEIKRDRGNQSPPPPTRVNYPPQQCHNITGLIRLTRSLERVDKLWLSKLGL